MRILLTGATGFVGTPLARALYLDGHQLVILSRDAIGAERTVGVVANYHSWEPTSGPPPREAVAGIDAVLNLMGENIGAGRWTAGRKRAIYDSRVIGTQHLVESVDQHNPDGIALWVNFSAIGFYPVNEDRDLDEAGAAGEGFAATVCKDWEATAARARSPARTLVLRVGTVFGAGGGALARLLPAFKAGVGGPVGHGRQMMSWIHRQDLVQLCRLCLENEACAGVINAVAPEPVSNRIFSLSLGRAVGRPAILPTPAPALRIAFGEMSQLVLDGQQIVSNRLRELGFEHRYGRIDAALGEAVGRMPVGLEGKIHVCDRYEDFVVLPGTPAEVFPFFADPMNLERITPPLLKFRVERVSDERTHEGTRIDYRLKLHGIPMTWKTLIRSWSPPDHFVDYQLAGPYRLWNHTHTFTAVADGTAMHDRVDYELPLGPLGGLARPLVELDIKKIFDFRRQAIRDLLG